MGNNIWVSTWSKLKLYKCQSGDFVPCQCMYINMETVVGTSTGVSALISVFSTMLYKLQKNVKNNDKWCTAVFRLALVIRVSNSNRVIIIKWY